MAGGCYSGPEGTACWGSWWVGPIFVGVLLLIAIALVATLILIARNPAGFVRRLGRNLLLVPLLFIAYMAVYTASAYLRWRYHLSFWASLALVTPAFVILTIGNWFLQRSLRRPRQSTAP